MSMEKGRNEKKRCRDCASWYRDLEPDESEQDAGTCDGRAVKGSDKACVLFGERPVVRR